MLVLPLAHRPQDDAVVARLEVRVAHAHASAGIEVDSVVVDHALVADDRYPVRHHVFAQADEHRPQRAVLEGDALQPHAPAADELDHQRTELRLRPVSVRRLAVVECRTLSVNRPLPRDRDVFRVPCLDEGPIRTFGRHAAHIAREIVVVLSLRASKQNCPFLQVQLHVASEAQRSGWMHARRDDDAPPASSGCGVNRLLNLRAPALGGNSEISRIRRHRAYHNCHRGGGRHIYCPCQGKDGHHQLSCHFHLCSYFKTSHQPFLSAPTRRISPAT